MSDLLDSPVNADHMLWKTLWETPESAVDIFQSVAPSDVRKLIKLQPGNLHTLITQAVHQMTFFVEQPDHQYHKSALNCVRFLTRVMPFIFETLDISNDGAVAVTVVTTETKESNQFLEDIFWKPPAPSSSNNGEKNTPTLHGKPCLAQRMIAAMMRMLFLPDFTIDKVRFANMCRPPPRSDVESGSSGSDGVVGASRDAASVAHYPTANPGHVWEYGVRVPYLPESGSIAWGANARLEANRSELLKLLVTCMCRPLYVEPHLHPVYNERWMSAICETSNPLQETLLLSLLNMITTYDPIGTGMLSYLPFASTVMDDPRERHIDACCHALLVLLDYAVPPPDPSTANATASHPSADPDKDGAGVEGDQQTTTGTGTLTSVPITSTTSTKEDEAELASVPSSRPTTTSTPPPPPTTSTPSTTGVPVNQYHVHLRSITEVHDFDFLFDGLARLLNNIPESMNTYLPNSQRQVQAYQEILTILWQCIDLNPAFREHVVSVKSCEKLVFPCLYLMYEYRRIDSMSGLLHLCTFLLLHMSGSRDFGVALNRPLEYKIPSIGIPTMTTEAAPYGTHVDLCVVVFHKMLVDGMRSLRSLYNCMLTILSNISPYVKTMSLASSLKLVSLFEIFASKKFLLSDPNHNQYIFFLLDIFNNIIQYQYNGNHHLIYAMVRRKEHFDALVCLRVEKKSANQINTNNEGEKTAADTTTTVQITPTTTPTFVATQDWLDSWKSKLPLRVIVELLEYLKPKVEALALSLNGLVNESDIVTFIRETTMVGVLPQPHPIVVRKYQPNKYTSLWFTTFLWGVVFMRNQSMPLWDGTKIKIFSLLESSNET